MEVGYLRELPEQDDGPFLKEERALLQQVAVRLGRKVERKRMEDALRKREAEMGLLLNSTAEGIYGLDADGNCTFANPACVRMLGYTDASRLHGRNMHDLIHHSHPDGTPIPAADCHISRAFKEGRGMHRDDEVFWRADGTSFPAEYWSYPQLSEGKISGSVVTFLDITERQEAARNIAQKGRRLADIIEGTNVGTWEWNVQTGKTVFNERWAEMIGYTLAELEPVSIETWSRFTHPDDLKAAEALLARHFRKETPYYECELRMRHRNGSWIWVLDKGRVAEWTADDRPLFMSGTHQEITARKAAEAQIRHLATHDVLTGLPSMRLAKDRLSMALAAAHRNREAVAVMFLDLDGFKEVNDTFGHDTGDSVLVEVARRLRSCLRETDTAARIGGDEFLVVATGLRTPEGAAQVAEKIVRLLSRPFPCDDGEAAVGVSIGIALYPADGADAQSLIRQADKTMYRVKKSGKNGFRFAGAA